MLISRTPFRISFFGGGSDYPAWIDVHGSGAVLSTAIDKYAYLTVRYLPPFFDHRSRIVWSEIELVKDIPEIHHPAVRECLKFLSITDGVEIHHDGDLPARSGLGSSSSFTIGLLNALYALKGRMASARQLASDTIYVEQEMKGECVGFQDSVAAAFGGFNRINFAPAGEFRVTPITVGNGRLRLLAAHLMLVYTGQVRDASEIAQEQVRLTPQRTAEIAAMQDQVDEAVKIVCGGDLLDFGRLMHEGWLLKKSLSPKITTALSDTIYEVAQKHGAIGGKICGAGGGGFFLLFVPPNCRAEVKAALKDFLEVPFTFEPQGSRIVYYDQPEEIAPPFARPVGMSVYDSTAVSSLQ